MLSLKPRPFVQSSFDMQAPRSHFLIIFSLVYLEMSLFPSTFCTNFRSLCMEGMSYVLSFRMVFFYTVSCDYGLDF